MQTTRSFEYGMHIMHAMETDNVYRMHLNVLYRGLSDMQTLASDAVLEKDLRKAHLACAIDPATAACATPAKKRACFDELLAANKPWLEGYWGL